MENAAKGAEVGTQGDGEEIEHLPFCKPEGRTIRTDHNRGEEVCEGCGIVVAEGMIDHSEPERSFSVSPIDPENRSHYGPPASPRFWGSATTIGYGKTDGKGKHIERKTHAQMGRLRWVNSRQTEKEKSLGHGLREVERISSGMELPVRMREIAAANYRRAREKQLVSGRSIAGIASALVYAACREAGRPRTLDEVAGAAGIDTLEVGRAYMVLHRELKLKLPPTQPAEYIDGFCNSAGANQNTRAEALRIAQQMAERGIYNNSSPVVMACSIIYLASIVDGHRLRQKRLAGIGGVTEVSIRNNYKPLAERLGIPLPKI